MRSETQALLLHLAWAQKDCPNRDEVNYYGRAGFPSSRAHIYEDWSHYRQEGRDLCPICKGRGKVPLFPDDVRQKCSDDGSGEICPVEMRISVTHEKCQGRGWVPSADPMVWAGVLHPVLGRLEGNAYMKYMEYMTALVEGEWEVAISHAVWAMEMARILDAEQDVS